MLTFRQAMQNDLDRHFIRSNNSQRVVCSLGFRSVSSITNVSQYGGSFGIIHIDLDPFRYTLEYWAYKDELEAMCLEEWIRCAYNVQYYHGYTLTCYEERLKYILTG